MFKGSITALITPFTQDGAIDEKAFQSFVDWQLKQGTTGVVPVGTTGESPTLSHAEHHRVVELALEVAKGRGPVIAGTGFELDSRSGIADPACPECRCRCRPCCDAVLQQADPERFVRAFQGGP